MTPANCALDSVDVEPFGMLSDHSFIVGRLLFFVGKASMVEKLVRGWRRVDRNELRQALEDSELCRPPPPSSDDADVDQLFTTYDTVLRRVADRLVPQHSICRPPCRLSPWFDTECHTQGQQCRRLERRYRKTGTSTDRRFWVDATRSQILLHRRKKEEYWRDRLALCGRSSAALWRSLSTPLGRHREVACATDHTADGFATFFVRKVEAARSDTAGLPPPPVLAPATSLLASLRPCAQTEIRRIIMTSPLKSCSLDPVPTFLVREYLDVLLPYITRMVKRC